MDKYELGLYKSPFDNRDYLIRGFFTTVILPERYSIEDKMTPVRSQAKEGACVGFALAVGVKEYQEKIDYKRLVELSPRYIYEEAKKISGHTEGTTLKAAMQVVRKMGVCEERLWPYEVPQVISKSSKADSNAERFKVKTYARVINLTELKHALVQFGPILIGVKVYKGMMSDEAKGTGIVPNPSCWNRRVLGGHALCAVSYDDKSPYFKNDGHIKCKNSWGEAFGDKGYIYLSYRYIKANMIDAFSCVDIQDPKPYRVANLPFTEKEVWV